jgi:hypothetical protein
MESGEGKGADFLDGCQQSYMFVGTRPKNQHPYLHLTPFLQSCEGIIILCTRMCQDDNTLAGLEEWSQVKVRVLIFWTGANKAI